MGNIEGPRTFVPVFLALAVVPGSWICGIAASLGEFLATDISQRRQTLRVPGLRVGGIAARIAIEIKEERELDQLAVADPITVICAISGGAALHVNINRIIAVATGIGSNVAQRNLPANLAENSRGRTAVGSGRDVNHVALIQRGHAHLPIGACVFVGSSCVVRTAEACIPGSQAGDLISDESRVRPARSPEDLF